MSTRESANGVFSCLAVLLQSHEKSSKHLASERCLDLTWLCCGTEKNHFVEQTIGKHNTRGEQVFCSNNFTNKKRTQDAVLITCLNSNLNLKFTGKPVTVYSR